MLAIPQQLDLPFCVPTFFVAGGENIRGVVHMIRWDSDLSDSLLGRPPKGDLGPQAGDEGSIGRRMPFDFHRWINETSVIRLP